MRLVVTVVSPAAGPQADVVIDADPGTAVMEIAAELDHLVHGEAVAVTGSFRATAAGFPAAAVERAAPALFVGGHRVPGDMRLADSPLMDGCVVSLGDPAGCLRPEPPGVAELRVAGGPAAGAVHRLVFGEADVGGLGSRPTLVAVGLDIVIADPAIPPLALRVLISHGGGQVAPYGNVPVLLDGQPLDGAAYWRPGQQVAVGDTLLDLVPYKPPDAALHPSEDGAGLEFNRPPRLLPPEHVTRFGLPSPPGRPERRPVPVLMAVVPVILGVAMAYFLRQVYMLAMAAFSPVMLLGSYVSDRRGGRKSYARQQADYTEHKARVERDAREALDAERLRRRHDCPDPATVLSIASGPRRRLWERRRSDPDYLLLRAGTADLPSEVELTDPTRDEHRRRLFWLIPDAPVTIPLAERAVVGIAGPGDMPRAAGRWLVAQVAALHSPEDVQVCVLTDASGQDEWAWVRWLPHCRPAARRPAEGQDCAVLIGTDAETVAARIAELLAIITARRKALGDRPAGTTGQARSGSPATSWSSSTGPASCGPCPARSRCCARAARWACTASAWTLDERLLPAECQAVAVAGPDGTLRGAADERARHRAVRPDVRPAGLVRTGWPGRIAPLRDVSGDEEDSGLPDACRLLDVLGLEPPAAEAIVGPVAGRGRSTVAVIGACYDGPFGIDLRQDGPHALIAGTTGSGKSELLQTMIASLACANRPDEMTFVLVDYKGGSAFTDCVAPAALPSAWSPTWTRT